MTEINIDPNRVPKHIAIVMDGNGRWATRQGLSRAEGHFQGYRTLRRMVEDAADMGIKVLTVYAFSTENWRRPQEEVNALMTLFINAARAELEDMKKLNVRMRISGRLDQIPDETRNALMQDVEATSGNTRITLNLALNYGGRAEIVDAARKIVELAISGEIKPEDVNEELISQNLYSPNLPDPDLVIRTAGEMRISNFLLWEVAYSEFYVTETLWPDFTKEELEKAILNYQGRTRRFGAVVNEDASK